MFRQIATILLIVSTTVLLGAYAVKAHHNAAADAVLNEPDAMQVLKQDGRYKILVMALQETDLNLKLNPGQTATLFAPTDEAFQKVPKLAELLRDNTRLAGVLRNHLIIGEKVAFNDLKNKKRLLMYGGKSVDVRSDGRNVNDARIEFPDITAGNVVIHGIDKVLMENNDSKLRQAGEVLEDGVKMAGHKVYDGLKTGAGKVKETFSPDNK
jgi:uncharacterized surface protein with fasciclin (FAS1) repeats